ncbi:hypothetical protein [Teredinibacter purpureus]|uniref:hypothetical protein n=1 Tax=Teredinibacter purpureus TaxID=2731756 RepID=UPI0005F7CC0E|nr:hypothetical protein [Teredinibacter purpureus]
MLRKQLSIFFPASAASGVGFSPFARNKYLEILERNGIDAHYYLPSVGSRGNDELCEALDALAHAGYIMTDSSGYIVGTVAKARLSNNEKAKQ